MSVVIRLKGGEVETFEPQWVCAHCGGPELRELPSGRVQCAECTRIDFVMPEDPIATAAEDGSLLVAWRDIPVAHYVKGSWLTFRNYAPDAPAGSGPGE